MTYSGSCFCGAVEITVSGKPEAQGFCHCSSCRKWSAAPVNAFSLWPLDSVEVVKGAELVAEYHQTERSYRKWCKSCGGHLLTVHPHWKLVDVYAATIPGFPFAPGVHVNYGEHVVAMRDGLPKLVDLPKEMGGSGEAMAE
jgi:hypothetical protein